MSFDLRSFKNILNDKKFVGSRVSHNFSGEKEEGVYERSF